MATQYTWNGLWQLSMREAGLTTSQGFNTAQNALAVLSEAQHELQQISNAVQRSLTVAVSPGNSADGSYALSPDVKLPLTWQFMPQGGAQALDVRPLTFDEMDLQKRLGSLGAIQVTPITSLNLTAAVFNGTLYIYPYQAMTGTLTLKYIAHLWPFDVTNPVGDWAAFGANPLATMKTAGPATEFGTAIMGMKDYLTMRLIEDMPDALKRFPTRYQRAAAGWERAKQYAVRDKLQMNSRQLFRPRNGVLQ